MSAGWLLYFLNTGELTNTLYRGDVTGDFQIFNFCNRIVIVRYDFSEIQLQEAIVYQPEQTRSVNTGEIRNSHRQPAVSVKLTVWLRFSLTLTMCGGDGCNK